MSQVLLLDQSGGHWFFMIPLVFEGDQLSANVLMIGVRRGDSYQDEKDSGDDEKKALTL
jgi:hypothetical protein